MRKNLGAKIALALFFLSSASWAQLNLDADPLWRALMRGPLGTAAPVAAHPAKSLDDPDCQQFHHGDCIYSWDPDMECCVGYSETMICKLAC